ncbi:MAG: PD-(D/E)XK nuclease family transposase [Bacteroidales bacterium]|nr:PD-(D/E)XK nuclease family transposase [Bacteroidales bacterium]
MFGQKKHKRLIKELLEHVFDVKTTELAFVNVEHPGETKADRNAVFDLQCSSEQIGDFIVEVQVKEQAHFDKCAVDRFPAVCFYGGEEIQKSQRTM